MYITQNDLIIAGLYENSPYTIGEIIRDLINDDEDSDFKEDVNNGHEYYIGNHKYIDEKDFRKYYINEVQYIDYNAANNKIVANFPQILIDQKNGYICGNPIVIQSENDNYIKDLTDLLGKNWDDFIARWECQSSQKGAESVHPYIDENGNFKYIIIPIEQLILIYDSKFEQELLQVIRYYKIKYLDNSGTEQERYKVEWWTDKDVTYYIENDKGIFDIDSDEKINPRPHWQEINSTTGKVKNKSWGRVPFVVMQNNDDWQSDLNKVKTLVDAYDVNMSDFANNLEDIQEAVWKVAGYEGTDVGILRQNLKTFKIVLVSEDGTVEPITLEVPKEARDSYLDRLEENIYQFGMGVNNKNFKDGQSPSGVALKRMYALLDLKAKKKIRKMEKALYSFMEFATDFIGKNYNVNELEFTFNLSMIMNENEQIQSNQLSKGLISEETRLANHPWVNDVGKELKSIEQNQENIVNLDDINGQAQ